MSNLYTHDNKRSSFSGKLGYVLSAAGASVGLGNIWRFPYLAAKYGGGIFLLIYILLALTFGYTMIMAETSLGRMTKKSPVGAFASFGKSHLSCLGGWINAIIPVLIVPYYSVIGGWVLKYLVEYVRGHAQPVAEDGYFSAFISDGFSTEICFVIFSVITLAIIYAGVRNGIERVSKFMMPILVVLSVIIAIYSVTRPGALAGVKYFLVPNVKNFSWMTVVAAMGQMFYSLSIAMGILITFGSYMKKDISIEESTKNVEIFDTTVAIMAGLMIFIKKTKAGQAMLAVSEDKDAAQLMGVNVNATISLTFAIGSGLAAIAGVLFCSAYPTLTPYTGSMPGIKAFVPDVSRRIGSIPGAMVGGILLGVIEIFSKAYISSQVADAIVFAVLIVVLLVKPSGLFGKNIQEKV